MSCRRAAGAGGGRPTSLSVVRRTVPSAILTSSMPGDQQPTTKTVLAVLAKTRIVEVRREFGVVVPATGTKDVQVAAFADSGQVRFQDVLGTLGRDELKAACRAHGLDDSGRARPSLAARLLQAHGAGDSIPPAPIFAAREIPRYAPRPGDIVQVQHRQYLALDVEAPRAGGDPTLVLLAREGSPR